MVEIPLSLVPQVSSMQETDYLLLSKRKRAHLGALSSIVYIQFQTNQK